MSYASSTKLGEAVMELLSDAASQAIDDQGEALGDAVAEACKTWCGENLEEQCDLYIDSAVDKVLEKEVEGLDLGDVVEEAVKSFNLANAVEVAIGDAGIGDAVDEAISGFLASDEFNEKLDRVVVSRVDAALRRPDYVAELARVLRSQSLLFKFGRLVKGRVRRVVSWVGEVRVSGSMVGELLLIVALGAVAALVVLSAFGI